MDKSISQSFVTLVVTDTVNLIQFSHCRHLFFFLVCQSVFGFCDLVEYNTRLLSDVLKISLIRVFDNLWQKETHFKINFFVVPTSKV